MERANYNVARWRRRPEEQQKQIEKVSDKGRRGCPQIAGCKHAIGAREASPALQRIDENRKPIDRRPEEKRRRMWTRCRLVGPGGVEEEVPAGIRPGIARRTEQVHEDKPRAFGATCWNAPLQRDFFNFGCEQEQWVNQRFGCTFERKNSVDESHLQSVSCRDAFLSKKQWPAFGKTRLNRTWYKAKS
ncbi:hypothetical protein L596_024167 [Steinernema carpocapsae]|uniref:Uncharacterized protein n=1 Tax=Steinernema carpocapsae TaxID=34508 RepID=A0A4U5MFY3_STECR|nr:hypothetical protein L596_024167 [Steinernema carpocapsae]